MAAALALAATPCLAADLPAFSEKGERRSGAVAGAYIKVPLSPGRNMKRGPQAGLRLAMTHDYRTASAPQAQRVEANALDLRLVGQKQPTLFVAGKAVTGQEARKHQLGSTAGMIGIGVVVGLVVAAGVFYLILIENSGDE